MDLDSCKYEFYGFDLRDDGGSGFIVTISGKEIDKITSCLAAPHLGQGNEE